MLTIKGTLRNILVIISSLAVLGNVACGQNALQFIDVRATAENAILLYWASNPNEVYEIDYAYQLNSNYDGTTAWQPLYADYVSHGTNTFIADAGNYDITPTIPHPSFSPMRFYRIMHVQNNDASSNPTVGITSPNNGDSLSDTITVSVSSSSSDVLSEVKLYIDGELQWSSDDGTNFLVNTCEWPNGPHLLFATAKSQSDLSGQANGAVVYYGRSVSSYVNVTFDNLISRVNFSQPFFEPALGQTQLVTATFAAGVDWILQIQDANSNIVRTATGSSNSMVFNWDGTGDGGVSIPDGVYTYFLTAQTNGRTYQSQYSGGGSGGPPLPAGASLMLPYSSELFAAPADGSGAGVPLILYPPGFDTNGLTIFRASLREVMAAHLSARSAPLIASGATDINGAEASGPMYSGASSQSTRTPQRKPRIGVKGEAGTFGICYKSYGTNGFSSPHPLTGWPYPLPMYVAIDGQSRTAQTTDRPIPEFKTIAADFSEVMQKKGWKQSFVKVNDQWGPTDIKKASLGGKSIFNGVNFGMVMTHGSYGNNSSTGTEADGVIYTYLALGNQNWVRLTDMGFGSPGTNGLRWMTILACNMLQIDALNSMIGNGKTPMNDNLHLLMGCASIAYGNTSIGRLYASNLVANVEIPQAWFNMGRATYHAAHKGITNGIVFRVMGNGNCQSDTFARYNDPDPSQAGWMTDDLVFDPSNP